MSRDDLFRAPKGVHDVLPPESGRWTAIVARFAERARRYGYGLAITPMFEHIEVFQRVGEHTDVVAKEMYELTDKGGRRLGLRPEGTASVVRAYVQHRPTPPWKVWYVAPNFRYERAQKGRYRQHWQLGVEALGVDDPDIDVEVIALLAGFYRDLGLVDTRLLLNSMGDAETRPALRRRAAVRTSSATAARSGEEFLERVAANPLRVLDTQGRGLAGRHRARRRSCPSTCPTRRPRSSRPCRRGCARSGSTSSSPPGSCGASTTTPRPRSSSRATRSTARRTRSAAAAATTGSPRRWAVPPRPASASAPGIERIVLALEASGVAAPAPGTEVFVVDGLGDDGGTTVGGARRGAADRGLRGRPRLRRPVGEGAVEGGRPLGRARSAVMVGRDELARDAVAVKDLASGEQVEVPRDRDWSRGWWLAGTGSTRERGIDEHADARRRHAARRRHRRRGDARRLGRGARRDHGGVVFFDLRGAVSSRCRRPRQVVGPTPGDRAPSGASSDVHHIGREWVLQVTGPVRPRPEGTVNPDLPTGEVEVAAATVVVLNRAEPPPFPLTDRGRRRRRGAAAAAPLPGPAPHVDAAQPAPAVRRERRAADVDGRAGFRRDRDADADRVDARRGRGTSWCRRVSARASSTRSRRARSSSSSCSWSEGSTATSRSRAACATRTCAATGSSSSCSTTWR